jgi:hypothetical protein
MDAARIRLEAVGMKALCDIVLILAVALWFTGTEGQWRCCSVLL